MNRIILSLIVSILFAGIASAETPRKASFDADWKFKFGESDGADKTDFADSDWRKLDLPHDWMIEGQAGKDPTTMDGPFDRRSPGGAGNGSLNGGVGWYRKTFTVPAADKGKHIAIDFDGVYMNSHVWINGHDLGVHPYGYTSFEYDLTPDLKYGDEKNVIAVRTEVTQPCSRFYSGAGIYRNVWLTTTNAVHVGHWGTYVITHIDGNTAVATVRTTVVNDGSTPAVVSIHYLCASLANGSLTRANALNDISLEPGKQQVLSEDLKIDNFSKWSLETPSLYMLDTRVLIGGTVVDTDEAKFGIRTIEFTNEDGFHLNGKRVQIQGVCDHHDLGCLGAAVNRRAIQRQLEILKSFGVNAIRTSHYPPTPELLDLCDEMGFVVMDEAFDEWKKSKTRYGYGQFFDDWSERDITSMVDRDRNHPSIVMWSIGNEINEQGDMKNGEAMAKRLADFVHREDPTRPTVSAMSNPGGAFKSGFSKALGVFGVNYNIGFYNNAGVHGVVPMLGSETSSALSSRGDYGLALGADGNVTIQKQFNHQVTGYDIVGPRWGNTAHDSLAALKSHAWMAGEFVWTGFDYIGEPTPYNYPSRSSYFGIVDLAGFPKDRYYLYKSQWTNEPVVHLLPHWNWDQFTGKEIPVWCFTNADSVELFLNDKSLGEKTSKDMKDLHLEWSVPYAPGVLKAVGKKDGKVIATDEIHTAGKAAKIVLKADRSEIKPVDRDLSFITVSIQDADGNICPLAQDEIKFTVDGPGTIAGLDNGDATNHEPFQGNQHKVYNGLGLVVIQAGTQTGEIHLTATADGLTQAATTVSVK